LAPDARQRETGAALHAEARSRRIFLLAAGTRHTIALRSRVVGATSRDLAGLKWSPETSICVHFRGRRNGNGRRLGMLLHEVSGLGICVMALSSSKDKGSQ